MINNNILLLLTSTCITFMIYNNIPRRGSNNYEDERSAAMARSGLDCRSFVHTVAPPFILKFVSIITDRPLDHGSFSSYCQPLHPYDAQIYVHYKMKDILYPPAY